MSEAERYIELVSDENGYLCDQHALKAVEIAKKETAESFARIIRGNLSGIGNGIQNMFEQLYTDITGEKMYKGFID